MCLSVCVSEVIKMASKGSKYVTILLWSTLVAGEPTQLREKELKVQTEKCLFCRNSDSTRNLKPVDENISSFVVVVVVVLFCFTFLGTACIFG